MFLGIAGLVPGDWTALSRPVAERIGELGFSVVQIQVNDVGTATDRRTEGVRRTLEDAGLMVGQTVGGYGGGLVSADEGERSATIKFVKRMVNMTGRLGSPNTYLRPGSLNPAGGWLPHPGNRSPEVFDRLVDSTRQIAGVAENEGVKLAVDGGVACPLHSPERTREFLDAVGSRAVGFNMDPVNYVGGLDDAYDTTALLDRLFDELGSVTIGAHARDFRMADQRLPRLEEEVIGRGLMDHAGFLRRMQEVCPSGHVLIEQLPDDQAAAARARLEAAAERAGVTWQRAKVRA